MKTYSILLSGKWGHFRRPEANNNPISYDFIPKTAFIGLMAAVVGLKRTELKEDYEYYCRNIFYTVEIKNPIKKISTNFRIYKYKGGLLRIENPPQFYEVLKNPKFKITFFGQVELVDKFIERIRNNQSVYQPILGLANCDANIEFVEEKCLKQVSKIEVKTRGLIPKADCNIRFNFEKGQIHHLFSYDNIPIIQNDNWYDIEFKEVFYGYLPENEYILVDPSEYKYQFLDTSGLGYFFV